VGVSIAARPIRAASGGPLVPSIREAQGGERAPSTVVAKWREAKTCG
jgi:hypothetical protein